MRDPRVYAEDASYARAFNAWFVEQRSRTRLHMACLSPHVVGHQFKKAVPCGRCQNCNLSRRASLVGALEVELQHAEHTPYFVTFTYDDEHLRWSTGKEAGELLPEQKRAYDAYISGTYNRSVAQRREEFKRMDEDREVRIRANLREDAIDRARPMLEWFMEEQPPRPTHCKADIDQLIGRYRSKLKSQYRRLVPKSDRSKVKLPPRPRLLVVSENGGKYGRPHLHAITFDVSEWALQLLVESWRYGFVHSAPVTDAGIASYVSKDAFKSSYNKAMYLAEGVEPPAVRFPRTPCLGGQIVERLGRHIRDLSRSDPFLYERRRFFDGLGTTWTGGKGRFRLRTHVREEVAIAAAGTTRAALRGRKVPTLPETRYTTMFQTARRDFDHAIAKAVENGGVLPDELSEYQPGYEAQGEASALKARRAADNWNRKVGPDNGDPVRFITYQPVENLVDVRPRRRKDAAP